MFQALRKMAGERGAVAVEFSLALPLLLGVTAGVVEFGQAFHLRQNLVNAASEAARVGSQLSCPRPTMAEATAAAGAVLLSAGLKPSLARIALTNTGGAPGTDMLVSITYDAYLPMLSNFMHLTALGGGRIEVGVNIAAENE